MRKRHGWSRDIGVDLGTATILIYVRGKGIVLREPSVAAVDWETGKLLTVGREARQMLGRTPENIVAVRPLREGVISDCEMTEKMLRELLRQVRRRGMLKPRVVICVPSGVSEVEARAVVEAGTRAGARQVFLIEEPVAAAMGAGIDIAGPDGRMVVDIGGGTSDVAVLSLSGVVESASVKVAGDRFNEALIRYIRREYGILIGERTAEEIKRTIGGVCPRPEELRMEIRGRSLSDGLPRSVTVTDRELVEPLTEVGEQIIETITGVLERTPPELAADVAVNGIVMTGGGSLLWGIDELVTRRTGIETRVADDAVSCVACGTGMCLDKLSGMRAGTLHRPDRRQRA